MEQKILTYDDIAKFSMKELVEAKYNLLDEYETYKRKLESISIKLNYELQKLLSQISDCKNFKLINTTWRSVDIETMMYKVIIQIANQNIAKPTCVYLNIYKTYIETKIDTQDIREFINKTNNQDLIDAIQMISTIWKNENQFVKLYNETMRFDFIQKLDDIACFINYVQSLIYQKRNAEAQEQKRDAFAKLYAQLQNANCYVKHNIKSNIDMYYIIDKITSKSVIMTEVVFSIFFKNYMLEKKTHRFNLEDIINDMYNNTGKIVDNFNDKIAELEKEQEDNE